MDKYFALFSVGTKPEPYLNVENWVTWKVIAVLKGMAWLDPKEYMSFIENAKIGDMIVLKDIFVLVRLRYPEHNDDKVIWSENYGSGGSN